MPIQPVVGPASGGKSQWISARLTPGQVVLDFTRLYVALAGIERGPDGRYPERATGDPLLPLTSAGKAVLLSMAVERQLDGYVTSSSRDDVPMLERVTGQPATIIDPGEATVRARLADPITGELTTECANALTRWYKP